MKAALVSLGALVLAGAAGQSATETATATVEIVDAVQAGPTDAGVVETARGVVVQQNDGLVIVE